MLSHYSLNVEAKMSVRGFAQTENDIMMLYSLPMFHVFGMVASFLATIFTGGSVVMVPGTGLSIGSFLSAVEKERGTMFLGVPFIFALAVELAEKEGVKNDISSLRVCASAGAPLPVQVKKRFRELYGKNIVDCWGLTEAVCHVTCSSLGGTENIASVGKPLSGWKIRVADGDGRELPDNRSGEILVSGPVMKGYYNNSQATARRLRKAGFTPEISAESMKTAIFISPAGSRIP
jgi:long-chain acyl-CoA synthetase